MPSFDFEIANINISVNKGTAAGEAEQKAVDDSVSAFAWHYDSFPFVCVVMLSDCTGMVGGETALRTASGEIRKVRGPAMVRYSTSRTRIHATGFIEANRLYRELPS